jgi:protein SCO1/2
MKTRFLLLGLAIAGRLIAEPPCCPPAPAAPSCCAEQKPAAPLTAKSLFNLDATWTDDNGRPVSLASLRGQPVVLTMFFASCGYACPVLVSDMQRLRATLPAEVRAKTRFVLVSFDTVRDTPPALRAFRERSSLDANWTLLRGEIPAVQELAMLLGVKFKADANGQFSHSNVITILNAEGEIAHQRNGLMGDVSEAAKAVVAATR